MTYTVAAEGLTKAYGRRPVLRGVDLAVRPGTVYSLLGPNGAGKTTLVKVLATLVRPDGGRATIAGHDLRSDPAGVRRVISLTGQYAAVDDVLTGAENMLMMARLRKLSTAAARRRTHELLEEFDLVAARDRRVGTWSGGMRRRLDLALSVIERPALLFLDEPTTGLDPRSREQVWSTVRTLSGEGVTILLTTQYLEEADRLADHVAVLHGGLISAEGSASELKATLGRETVLLELDGPSAFDDARRAFPGASPDPDLLTVEVATDGTPAGLAAVLAACERHRVEVRRVQTRRPSLDDVFLALTDPVDLTDPADQAGPADSAA